MVHNLPCHQQAELQGPDIEVEITPAKNLLGLRGGLMRWLALRAIACLIQEQRLVSVWVVGVVETVSGRLGLDGCLVDGSGEDTGLVWRLNDPSCCSSHCASTHAIWKSFHHRSHWTQI